MASNFEWQTDEEAWPDESAPGPAGPRRPARLPLLLLLLGVTTIAALAGYRVLTDRAAAGVEEAEASLLATQGTLQRAAANADAELATELLSGHDLSWSAAQEKVIGAGLFYDRSPWSLELVDGPAVEAFAIHPTLQSAVVTTTQTVAAADGVPFTVRRRQLYRRHDARWLIAPQRDDGVVWTQNSSTIFTISYRNRDARVGAPLAAQLEARLRSLCALGTLECTGDGPLIAIRLTDDPRSLLHAATPVPTVQRTNLAPDPTLELPSPGLMGEPVDNTGAAALVKVYLRLIIEAVLADEVGYRCCDRLQLHATLSAYQQAAIGMNSPPEITLDPPPSLTALEEIWNATDLIDDGRTAATLVEFLRDETGLTLAQLHRSLATTRQRALTTWIGELLPDVPADLRDRLWQSYLEERRYAAAVPDLLPAERFVGLCPTPSGTGIFHLDVGQIAQARNGWPWAQTYLLDRQDVTLSSIGNGDLLLLQEETTANLRNAILFLEEQRATRLSAAAFGRSAPVLFGDGDPGQRYLPGFVAGPQRDSFSYILLDRQACTAAECPLLEIDGQPIWSPNSRRTVLLVEDRNANAGDLLYEYALHLAGPTGDEPAFLAYGRSPAWLDDRTLLYVDRSLQEIENAVRRYRVGQESSETVLMIDQLLEHLPLQSRLAGEPYLIDNLFINPYDREQIYVVVRQQQPAEESHLFLYRNGTVRYIARTPGTPDRYATRFAADGRRMAISLTDPDNRGSNLLFLHDVYHNHHELLFGGVIQVSQRHPGIDWSEDGQWLLVATHRGPTLVAPAFDQIVAAPPTGPVCETLFWSTAE